MKIAVDFDGTCVEHEFPKVGADAPHAVEVLKWLVEQGHELTLFTMRSRGYLEDAVGWFLKNDIKLTGIQYEKSQTTWTNSNKCYAQVYIDDASLGAPLIHPAEGRPYMDWLKVKEYFENLAPDVDLNPVFKEPDYKKMLHSFAKVVREELGTKKYYELQEKSVNA